MCVCAHASACVSVCARAVCVTIVDACHFNICQYNGRCNNTTYGFYFTCNGIFTGGTCSGRYYYY